MCHIQSDERADVMRLGRDRGDIEQLAGIILHKREPDYGDLCNRDWSVKCAA